MFEEKDLYTEAMPSCPSCGADVPEGFAFCGRCGAPLAAARQLLRSLGATAPLAEAER
jgi:predicted amidophosphoribosyltransferase